MTNKKTKQKKLTKQHSCITNKKMNPSAAALTVFNNYFAELQEKYTKAVESKQEEQQQQLAARQLTIINKPITVVPRMAQLNGLNTIDNAKQQQQQQQQKQLEIINNDYTRRRPQRKNQPRINNINYGKSQLIKQIFVSPRTITAAPPEPPLPPPPPPLPPMPTSFITPPVYKVHAGTWNESCFGTGKAERFSCDGKKIPLICGCQQRVSQQWCAAKCGGMYQFPMNTPGSASVSFVTFY
jgi:hypothetical protein